MVISQDRPFRDALAPQERESLLSLGAPRTSGTGEVLMCERDASSFVLAILAGWSAASVETDRGARVILALRGAGEVVGDPSAVDQRPRGATVTALGRVETVSVPGALPPRPPPQATSLIMRRLSGRLRSADLERRSLASEAVRENLETEPPGCRRKTPFSPR
jgi:CRP-like cAMP-binding protein